MRKLFPLILFIYPTVAIANVVWPALILETRILSWWAITLGLSIEYLFVRKLLQVQPKQAIIYTIFANIVSAILGLFLIPISGIIWEMFPGSLIYHYLNVSVTWWPTFIMACLINVALEGYVYKDVFGLRFRFKSKLFFWFLLANALSVGAAFASIFIIPLSL